MGWPTISAACCSEREVEEATHRIQGLRLENMDETNTHTERERERDLLTGRFLGPTATKTFHFLRFADTFKEGVPGARRGREAFELNKSLWFASET